MRTAAILTASDGAYAGRRHDASGQWLVERCRQMFQILDHAVVPDDLEQIESRLWAWVAAGVHLIVTTGGTGLGPRDVTPEAVRRVIDKEVPGMAEAMRQEGLKHTPHAMLSRQVVGIVKSTLIVALPGSPRAVAECMDVIWPALPHALDLLAGHTQHRDDAP